MMNSIGRTGILLLALIGSRCELSAQAEIQQESLADLPQFYFDALCFASDQDGKGRLDVYIEVPYEQLHFTNDGQIFKSSYDVTIDIFGADNKLVDEKFWTESVETKDYRESVSARDANLSQRSFTLLPAQYTVEIQVTDNETKKTLRRKRSVTVRNFALPTFVASDIMLVKRLTTEGANKVIYPNITGNVGDVTDGFSIFFEVYNRLGADSAFVYVRVRNHRNEQVGLDTCILALEKDRNSCFCRVNASELAAGEYTLDLESVPRSPAIHALVKDSATSSTRSFQIRWRGLPATIADLDIAIDQLQYVTEKENLEKIKAATGESKREMFLEFWRKKDPTPGTERNELMEEYYARIDYANKHFTHYYDGWKTDMGMVYVIFGQPGN
ncbi:MAG TPA: GWxTD domain-containing protein, partial [Bacteroidota bacterium]|nr:GWxTD domain-containing protein [Bacteroidota bacterium]